jgi:hypothetical protein
MFRFLKVSDVVFLAPATHVLDDVTLEVPYRVGVDVLDGLDGLILVVITRDLFV